MNEFELYELFEKSQTKYLSTKSREYLKNNSQFFTPIDIANKMLDSIDLKYINSLEDIRILEPSAGCGILILTTVLYLIKNTHIKFINIDAYEINSDLCSILRDNLFKLKRYIKSNTSVSLNTRVHNENFILKNSQKWHSTKLKNGYNLIISNPPFKKVNQTCEEAVALKEVVFGQPNIYALFIALSLKLLMPNGVYTVISPRSYLMGMYNEKLREYAFNNFSLKSLHSFDNRNIFKLTNQEVIISTFVNTKVDNNITISHNGRFKHYSTLDKIIYNKDNYSLLIPKNNNDISLLEQIENFKYSLDELGISVSVGPIVQFRNESYLSDKSYESSFAPLLVGKDILENEIIYYHRENTRKTHNKSISEKAKNLVKNSNYLLLRKVTAKDDKDPIVSAVLKKDFFNHELLGIDNNLLYFHSKDPLKELSIEECYGLFCYINSNYFNQLYSLINANHTINVSDFNNIKFPGINLIKEMGINIIDANKFDKNTCSNILNKYCNVL
ncbi:Eco57I restriction-modification methylase domain-containing protein [Clostridium sp. CX1]|uniref:Eco57I restriction-modification methylase domain-containing protein n=1 Tax=Clostridium sp. CX1 TaxID=2978346 RepID=UPI0021BDF6C2|nr:Eco57I restriction-modification methylase domain-containing protein [Clostridium sp. CX1]MCT8978695.1 Eco57I restriction-modification methylase domain-containing protein [Clostridium sp. CX1]